MKRNVRDTSKQSYHELSPDDLSDKQQTVLVVIHANPDCTDRELAELLGYDDPNELRPRRYELVDLGLVEQNGKRVCKVTGKKAYVWRIHKTD